MKTKSNIEMQGAMPVGSGALLDALVKSFMDRAKKNSDIAKETPNTQSAYAHNASAVALFECAMAVIDAKSAIASNIKAEPSAPETDSK